MILKTWLSPNWGDAVNQELARLISGKKAEVVKANVILKEENYLVVGSTLKFADNHTIVWGAGFIDEDDSCQGSVPSIRAVRGPKTRSVLLGLNIECPEVYGDPVLLFPRYFTPKVEKKYKLGIIPHWQDDFHPVIEKLAVPNGVLSIRHNLGTYEFINAICSCEKIASSSLHGIIVADAYGIPAIQLQFFPQSQFRFRDYSLSVSRPPSEPIDCSAGIDFEKLMKSFYHYRIRIDLDKLMDACPFKQSSRVIVISSFSRPMRNNLTNPKDYPYWKEVVKKFQADGFRVIQIGVEGEESIGADEFRKGCSFDALEELVRECETWLSVDNFFQHFCHVVGKPGIVIFSKSDPNIFGHKENVNLLKDRSFLRKTQFDIWERETFEPDAFVDPNTVREATEQVLGGIKCL